MKLNNKYYILRHGEALSNVKNVISSWPEKFKNPLTKKGRKQVKEAVKKLKNTCAEQGRSIDLIFASGILRARQTAEIIGNALKIKLKFDKRLREISFGIFNSKSINVWGNYFKKEEKSIRNSPPNAETYSEVLIRVFDFLKEIDKKYKRKNILIISHQCPLWLLENKVKGFSLKEGLIKNPEEKRIGKGELRELN